MKTHELTGKALDWAVAKSLGIKSLKKLEDEDLPYCFDLFHDIKTLSEARAILSGEPHCSGLGSEELRKFATEMGYVIDRQVYPAYSTDWAQGGPIIEREGIELFPSRNQEGLVVKWLAYKDDPESNSGTYNADGPTPLVAAMRCYVAITLGEEVEVPENLFSTP